MGEYIYEIFFVIALLFAFFGYPGKKLNDGFLGFVMFVVFCGLYLGAMFVSFIVFKYIILLFV